MGLENLTRTPELAYWWKENKQLSPYTFKYVWESLLLQTLLYLCNICFSFFLGNKAQSYSAQQNVPLRWHVPVFSWIEGNHQQDVSRSYQVGFAGKLLRKRGRPWYVLFTSCTFLLSGMQIWGLELQEPFWTMKQPSGWKPHVKDDRSRRLKELECLVIAEPAQDCLTLNFLDVKKKQTWTLFDLDFSIVYTART